MRAAIPAEKLLVFRGEDGWEPLCQYLGAPIPDMPFPQMSERAAFHRKRPHRQSKPIVQGR
ncbi:sulfotransferase [Streptosporangium sp. OZ121]|uniref:sulfotransferase n=1 Tax=Streptosporangium sp. OZ121 TaxID=3444183 RepID=UPI003F7A669E